jgi:hypothetical protein
VNFVESEVPVEQKNLSTLNDIRQSARKMTVRDSKNIKGKLLTSPNPSPNENERMLRPYILVVLIYSRYPGFIDYHIVTFHTFI